MEQLKAHAATKSTSILVMAVKMIGGDYVSREKTLARAAMLTVLEDREGIEFVDQLMDQIGM